MDLIKSQEGLNFTVTVKIKNMGNNDIENAQLNYVFIKDNDIINSELQSVSLEKNIERIYITNFSNVYFDNNSTYKAIATIYLGNNFIDTKTIVKQF